MCLARKFVFLSQLEHIICQKHLNTGNLATLLYKSDNPVGHTAIQFLNLKNMSLARKVMFLSQLKHIICQKHLKYGKSGNPVAQIWQPCWSYTIQSASIQFLGM